jgi:hypothetical protein
MITKREKSAVPALWFIATVCFAAGLGRCPATSIVWTNTAGGNWNTASNWSPNQVPVSGDDVLITNAGIYTVTNTLSATLANLTLGGTNGIQTLTISSLTLTSLGLVNSNGILNWNSGTINGSLTVAQGGILNITNNTTYQIFGALTNDGTVNWSAGSIYGYGPPSYNGIIYNAGLWNAQFDGSLTLAGGTPVFINAGIFRKSGGTGSTSIGWNFTSTGTFDVQTGSLSTSAWVGDNTLNGNYTGAISLTDTNATVLVASNAVLNWNSGTINGSLTVAQGGILNITNNTTYQIFGALTNDGTVNWSAGSIYGYGPPGYNGIIYNAGLWNAQFDGSLTLASGTPVFINAGTFRKSGGTGSTSIGWNFTNSFGILDAQTNTLSLAGNYDLTGGTLNVGIYSLAKYGIIHLSGSPAALTGTLSANLNNGYVPATGNTFDVLTYSAESGVFTNFLPPFAVAMQTNYGATKLTLTVLNVRPVLATNADQNLNELTTLGVTATATDMDAGQSLTYALVSGPNGLIVSPAGAIAWTPDETQGPSTNLVLVKVTDNGTPPLSATNSFTVMVNEVNVAPVLTVPANQAIDELTLYTNNATAMDADIPANTLTFALVSGPTNLTVSPSGNISWTPSEAQGPSTNVVQIAVTDSNPWAVNAQHLSVTNSFTITVNEVNVTPVLGAMSDATVNPGQTVNFTATASDADIPANTLTYSLVSPPSGATINSASGLFNWRPAVSQANTTNTVQVQVTDFNPFAVNSQHLSDTKSFKVVVNPLAPVVLTPAGSANGQFKFQVNGTVGPDYIIASSTNLSGWSDIFTNFSPSTPFQFTNTVTLTNRFFRARLSP